MGIIALNKIAGEKINEFLNFATFRISVSLIRLVSENTKHILFLVS